MMSGSGSGSYSGFGSDVSKITRPGSGAATGGGSTDDECILTFRTVLNSIDEEELKKLKVGEVLVLKAESRQKNTILAAIAPNNKIVGVITAPQVVTLLACIKKGYSYEAHISEIKSPVCKVEVRTRMP
jgi:hypothetical protein